MFGRRQKHDTERRMAEFHLTSRAESDLAEIADYTIETFGIEQARRYCDALDGYYLAQISETPCPHWARGRFRISHGWLHFDF